MRTGLSQIFDPYNLYAKAFPGIVFFILLLTILPKGSLSTIGGSGSLIAALVLLIIVLGFVFGQAIHSISGFIESSVYMTLRAYYRLYQTIIITTKVRIFGSESDSNQSQPEEISNIQWWRVIISLSSIVISIIITGSFLVLVGFFTGLIISFIGPVERLRRWSRSVLTPHRDVFRERLSKKDDLADQFIETVSEHYEFATEHSKDDLYIAAMSRLEFEGAGRARLFQAIFSFSRSLWIILIFYAIIYIIIGWNIDPPDILPDTIEEGLLTISTYQPTISNVTNSQAGMVIIGLVMAATSLLFFRSEAKYKHLFVDYVLVDYLTLFSNKEGTNNNSDTNNG